MINEYLEQLKANGKAENTIKTYAMILKALNNFKPVEQITKSDLIDFFKNLKGKDETKRTYQAKIKKFFNDNGKADLVEWIKLIKPKDNLRSNDVLTTEDINSMIEATDSDYWKAWIAIAFESGARFSEIRALRYKDFKETSEGLTVDIPTMKTAAGFRRILLIMSAEYYRNLKIYTNASSDDIAFPKREPWALTTLKEIGKKAGIEKHVNPHAFRHAQATLLVQQGIQEAIIRKKLGWTPTSPMIARYQHLDDNDVIEATLRNQGKTPQTLVFTELKQPEKLNLVDYGIMLSKLISEKEETKEKFEEYNKKIIELEKKIYDKANVNLELINYCLQNEENFKHSETFKHLRKIEEKW